MKNKMIFCMSPRARCFLQALLRTTKCSVLGFYINWPDSEPAWIHRQTRTKKKQNEGVINCIVVNTESL